MVAANFTMRNLVRQILSAMWHSAGLARLIAPAGQALLLQEFQNKLEAYYLFEQVGSTLDLPPGISPSLPHLIAKANKLGPYFSVWATEGVGHYIVDRQLSQGRCPHSLLSKFHKDSIPQKALVPLNAGMGLALAEWVLEAADRERRMDWAVLRKFRDLCFSNCTPGNGEVCFEALGLVARALYPHILSAIDVILCQHQREFIGYFWHGVGRAVYFSPTQALPLCGETWRGLVRAVQESPHPLGKSNVVAGFVWALTLVNIRHPDIVAAFLNQYGCAPHEREAFVNGLCSALLVWRDAQPDGHHLCDFVEYHPSSFETPLSQIWKTQVRQPWIQISRRSVRTEQGMGKLFRYQSFADLIASPGQTMVPEQIVI